MRNRHGHARGDTEIIRVQLYRPQLQRGQSCSGGARADSAALRQVWRLQHAIGHTGALGYAGVNHAADDRMRDEISSEQHAWLPPADAGRDEAVLARSGHTVFGRRARVERARQQADVL